MDANLITSKEKNPLSKVLLVFIILGLLAVCNLAFIIFNKGLSELINKRINAIISVFLIAIFFIAYHKKSIMAWWVGLLFFPILWSISYILYWTPKPWWQPVVLFLGWFLLILPIFGEKYKSYKSYIGESDVEEDSLIKDDLLVSEDKQNPLKQVLVVSIGMGLIGLYQLVAALFFKEGLMGQISMHLIEIIEICLIALFILAYLNKTMIAWWMALLFFPTLEIAYQILYKNLITGWTYQAYYSERFEMVIIVAIALFWLIFVLPYLCKRYKLYKNYIETE